MADDPQSSESVMIGVELVSNDWKLKTNIAAPAGPTRLIQLLPLANSMADAVTRMAEQAVEKQGQKISCKKGCGACCRWMVPISEVEARRIRELVESFPEPRRSQVLSRFAEALRRFDQAGLLDQLRTRAQWSDADYKRIEVRYFLQGIACPFLEDESCSIYPDRPVTCREFLVTSPAEKCALPTNEEVHMVKLPFRVMSALARFDPVAPPAEHIRWVPLVLALEWAAEHPDETPPRPGTELVRDLFQHVADRENAQLAIHCPAGP
jgi:Fe-S-cluster containining protein